MELPIYLDHAATTPVAPQVLDAMLPYFTRVYGNPAAIYTAGAEARDAVELSREAIASATGADMEDIYFTSGGTEANNWAIKGTAASATTGKNHLLVTPIEHHSVLDPCLTLQKAGFNVEFIPVDSTGLVEPQEIAKRIRRETFLVSVMHANNEVGTVQPIREIGEICRERGVPLHVDAVQTFGKLSINVDELGVSLMTLSAHKLYGPKGIGALYVSRRTRMERYLEGGEQEKGMRAGTLNVPGIVGFHSAVELASSLDTAIMSKLRDLFIEFILGKVRGSHLMGSHQFRLPNNAHFCFDGIEGESLLLGLDQDGIYASAGSACTAGSVEPSHVLLAMGVPIERARGAVRFTLGRDTTEDQLVYAADKVTRLVESLRTLAS
jgi:cysteine desulfurase